MEIDATYHCAWCGEPNEVVVDPSAGEEQSYLEDCQVCCRPNRLSVEVDPEREEAQVEAEQEGG